MRAQCPYCNHTESRWGDLIMRHIAKLHPTNLATVIQSPSMIREIEEHSPVNVKSDTEVEQESLTFDWTMTFDEETERAVTALGVQLQPFLGDLLEEREELDAMLKHWPSSTPTPKSQEASDAIATPVQADDSPYIPSAESATCQTEPLYKSTASQTEEFLDIQNCPHGARLPVHKHYVKRIEFPDGRIETTREIMVNCAECPQPAYKEVSREINFFWCLFFFG